MKPGVEGNAASLSSTQSKSKQERIRDNQRRSRARRQEYLAELERRLSECQLTCRDATIKEAALLELQLVNARLRELLALAGVDEMFVEAYVSQAIAQSGQLTQERDPSLRQLKPRVTSLPPVPPLNSNARQNLIPWSCGSAPTSINLNSASITDSDMLSTAVPSKSASDHAIAFPGPSIADPDDSTQFDWLYQPTPPLQSQNSEDKFCCDPFLTFSSQASPRVANDNDILCSVAKQMVEQYHISPAEMEQVKTKLATGFCRPAYPGADCAVDNETLFQVLNELSSQYSLQPAELNDAPQ